MNSHYKKYRFQLFLFPQPIIPAIHPKFPISLKSSKALGELYVCMFVLHVAVVFVCTLLVVDKGDYNRREDCKACLLQEFGCVDNTEEPTNWNPVEAEERIGRSMREIHT